MSFVCGPTAALIASTQAMPFSMSRSAVGNVKPSKGAALIAVKPSFAARCAVAANPEGVRGFVARLMLA